MIGPVVFFLAVAAAAAAAVVLWVRYRCVKSDRVSDVGSGGRRDDGGKALSLRFLRVRPVLAAVRRQERAVRVSVRSDLADTSMDSSPDVGDEA